MILWSLNSQKKTVNDKDLEKMGKFAANFGQDDWFKAPIRNCDLTKEIKENSLENEKYIMYVIGP